MKYIVCFSGGKDSTAMLINLLENDKPIDEILYVDVGDWMWKSAQSHIKKVEKSLDVTITQLDVSDELEKGFKRWGFPSFLNRWCTGVKRIAMRDYLREKYPDDEVIQYIGYCADEEKRAGKKLYSTGECEYPLIDSGITSNDALSMCMERGFDFGGVYEHHHHFNCWLCPLQKRDELYEVFRREPKLWDILRNMQHQTDGYFYPDKTIFDLEKQFWERTRDELTLKRKKYREKYNTKRGLYNK